MGPAARAQARRNTPAATGSPQSSAHHLVESSEGRGREELEHPRRPGHHQGHAGEDQCSGDPAERRTDGGD